jgi:hypothetical protein
MSPEGRDCDALCRASLYLTDVLMPHQIGKGQVAGSAIGVSFCDLRLQSPAVGPREQSPVVGLPAGPRLRPFIAIPLGFELRSRLAAPSLRSMCNLYSITKNQAASGTCSG